MLHKHYRCGEQIGGDALGNAGVQNFPFEVL